MYSIDSDYISPANKALIDNIYDIWLECSRKTKGSFLRFQLTHHKVLVNNLIHYSILFGHDKFLSSLLFLNVPFIKKDIYGDNFLHLACRLGNFKIVKILLDRHPHMALWKNSWGRLPVHNALVFQHNKLVNMMVKKKPLITRMRDRWGRLLVDYAVILKVKYTTAVLLMRRSPCVNLLDHSNNQIITTLKPEESKNLKILVKGIELGCVNHSLIGTYFYQHGFIQKVKNKVFHVLQTMKESFFFKLTEIKSYSTDIQIHYMRYLFNKKHLSDREMTFIFYFHKINPHLSSSWRRTIPELNHLERFAEIYHQAQSSDSLLSKLPKDIMANVLSFTNNLPRTSYNVLDYKNS